MKARRFVIAVLIVLLSMSSTLFAAGASESDSGAKTIGAIYWSLNNNFMVFLKDNIEAQAELLGYETFAMDSKNNLATELANIEDLISKGVDAVILVPIDSVASINAIRLLNEAGIPVVTVDRTVQDADVITSLESNNYDGGYLAGQFAAEELASGGNIAILRGTLATNLETERYEGFSQAVEDAGNPGIEIVSVQSADFDRTNAYDTTENILQAHPEINLIYCENDEMALGCAKAIEASNRMDVKVVGFDGAVETLQAISDGKVNGTVFQQFALIGRTAVDVCDSVFKGTADGYDPVTQVPCDFASYKNIEEFL